MWCLELTTAGPTKVRRPMSQLEAETGCLVGSHGVVIAVAGSAIKTVTRDAKPPRKTKFRARNPNGHPPLVRFAVRLVSSAHQTQKRRPEPTRKPHCTLHARGISRARSFDLEASPWAPTRLTSCISHPGPAKAYERLRSTLCSARAPFHHLAAPESTRKPLLHTRGISRAEKLRLGGDALGGDPTYLLYLPSRSRGGI